MRDFTIIVYQKLLEHLLEYNYPFQTVENYIDCPLNKVTILRHDIDKRPINALKFAVLESKLGIKGTYYFRYLPSSFNTEIIQHISELGHEIGYHYEDYSATSGNVKNAINLFENNLKKFRKLYPVRTICMHGSPMSKYDNRDIWNYINYKDYGLICEPYFDFDFLKLCYFTDTGRSWNSEKYNIRDKVNNNFLTKRDLSIRSTFDIINSIKSGNFPDNVLITTHPQRWHSSITHWLWEKVSQNFKNQIKYFINTANP